MLRAFTPAATHSEPANGGCRSIYDTCGTYVSYCFFFFKQKTAYEIGLGIPAEPLFRSQLIRNGRSASLQRTFKKSFTSFSHSTRNKTRDGLIRVRNIRALNGRFNTSITHAYSIVIGSKHITL